MAGPNAPAAPEIVAEVTPPCHFILRGTTLLVLSLQMNIRGALAAVSFSLGPTLGAGAAPAAPISGCRGPACTPGQAQGHASGQGNLRNTHHEIKANIYKL